MWIQGASVVVGVLALLVGIQQLDAETDDEVPRLSGMFNIVVAQFGSGPGGARSAHAVSAAVRDVVQVVENDPDLREQGFTIDVAGPAGVPELSGESASERSGSAARIARDTGADLVVYAAPDAALNRVVLGMMLSDRTLVGSEELGGAYEWFSRVTADDAFSNVLTANDVGGDVAGATEGLINFIVGLAYRDAGHDRRALQRFRAAAEADLVPTFQSMTHVFIGNAALSLERMDVAEAAFERALTFAAEGTPRALLGSAEIMFLRGSGDCVGSEQEERLLETAHRRYDSIAAAASGDPVIGARALFGSGRALMCLASGADAPTWSEAESRFGAVTAIYEAAPVEVRRRIFRFAAESHAGLGLVTLLRRDSTSGPDIWAGARWHYEQAVDLLEHWDPGDRDRIVLFESMVAFVTQHEHPRGVTVGGADVAAAGIVLPRKFVRRQVKVDFGGDGSPCDPPAAGSDPDIELLSAAQQVVEVGEAVVFCFPGFSPDHDLEVELREPESQSAEPVPDAAHYGWAKTFLPPSPLGTYTLTARQQWVEATSTFELVPSSVARVLTGSSPFMQQVHLVGYPPHSVVFLNLHRQHTNEKKYTGEYRVRYVSSLPVPINSEGTAVYSFPDWRSECAEYRISTIPLSELDVSSTISPDVCL